MVDRSNMFQDNPPEQIQQEDTEADVSPNIPEQQTQEYAEKQVEKPEPIHVNVEHEEGNIIDLPSKGLLGYPGSISYREIMAGDEEILKSATNKNAGRTMNRVVKSICNDADFFDDLYVGDRDFVIFWIWANTYDNIKEFEVTCQHCGHKEEDKVDMFQLPEIDINTNIRTRLPLKVYKTEDVLNIRMISVRDENNAEKFLADNPKEKYNMETVMFALALEFGKPMPTKDRVEYLKKNVTAKEMGIIKEYHRYFEFGLDTSFEHECSECGEVTLGQIPFSASDFLSPSVRTDFERLLRNE